MSKTTPTPWRVAPYQDASEAKVRIEHSIIDGGATERSYSTTACHASTEPNARLIVAAVNSYGAHCADPLAAAEADLLGKMMMVVKEASWNLDAMEAFRAVDGPIIDSVACDVFKQLLDMIDAHYKPQEATDAD